jgi:Mrp family chromosome partitioning ATPase
MSRTFELLQRTGKNRTLFIDVPAIEVPPTPETDRKWEDASLPSSIGSVRRLNLDIEGLGREESLKFVRRVFLSQEADAARTVVFSGVERAAGSTWNCVCAARTLAAQVSGRVCVVDGNFRHPALHEFFGVANGDGLAAAVTQSAPISNFLIQLGDTNLWLLPSGAKNSDLSRYCTPLDMELRLTELRDQFDYVLIDSPSINQYADALALGAMTDGVVLVIDSESTHRDAARRAAYNLHAAKVRTIGAVLNKRSYPIPQFIYRMIR